MQGFNGNHIELEKIEVPLVQRFRIDNDKPEKDRLEFYAKINNENGGKLLNLCLSGEGIYYYKPGSQILSPKESGKTRDTYDSYLSMQEIKELFDKLAKAGWSRKAEQNEEISLVIAQKGNKVILEIRNDNE